MNVRHSLLIAASSLTLAACGMLPGGNAGPDEQSPPEASESSVRPSLSPEITVSTEEPDAFFRQIGRYTTYARTDCNSNRERSAAFDETLEKLQRNALDDGADYLRVLGTGALERRGFCSNDMFQLTGVAFREQEQMQNTTGSGGGASDADSLTARLDELDALRERELISDEEYQQLRERVLDQAY